MRGESQGVPLADGGSNPRNDPKGIWAHCPCTPHWAQVSVAPPHTAAPAKGRNQQDQAVPTDPSPVHHEGHKNNTLRTEAGSHLEIGAPATQGQHSSY